MEWGRVTATILRRFLQVALTLACRPSEVRSLGYDKPAIIIRVILSDLFNHDLSEEALDFCRKLLRRPGLGADVAAGIASTLLDYGHADLAEDFCLDGLSRQPMAPALLCCYAILSYSRGAIDRAIDCLERVLSVCPESSEALSNLGNIYLATGKVSEAVMCYQSALRSDPLLVDALSNLGNALQQLGRLEDAVEAYQYALRLRPSFVPAMSNLGIAYQRMGLVEQAISLYQQSLELDPLFADAWSNLGLSLQSASRHGDALIAFDRALSLSPLDARYLCNKANCQLELGRIDDALCLYRLAMQAEPSNPDCLLSCAIALLLSSGCRDGWQLYEARLTEAVIHSLDPGTCLAPDRLRVWPDVPPKRLVLSCEQGFGDTIQFCRYAKYLADSGVSVILRVQASLLPVLQRSKLGVRLVPLDEPVSSPCDAWSPLLSLPGILGVSADMPLVSTPYLSIPSEPLEKWSPLFSEIGRPVVALNWQGNFAAEVNNLKGRSIHLEEFSILAEVPSIQFLAVQHGDASRQIEGVTFRDRFVEFQEDVGSQCSFEDVLALVACSSLLITSDTAVAHLAAAAGLETWLLLHSVPDWRWGLSGQKTFWYPTMRLFRQSERGEWRSVMSEVASALRERWPGS